jgi:nucleoside-diphosphate kinase
MYQKSFAMIKPHAFSKKKQIKEKILRKKISILKTLEVQLTLEQVETLYEIHKERPFYSELCTTISSGKVCLMILGGNKVISRQRDLSGATNPKEALPGTIRHEFGASIGDNAIHSSDSEDSFHQENVLFESLWIQHLKNEKKKRQPVSKK